MGADLYFLDGDVVRAAPNAVFWAEWMDNADRVVEMSQGYTPTSRWQLVSFFHGLEISDESGGPFFFATQLAEGATEDTWEIRRQPVLARTMAEALANHARLLDELRPSIGTGSDKDA